MRNKVLLLIESLAGGGAEKVLSTIVKHIDKTHFDITVCAINGGGKYEKDVASSVRCISIFKNPASYTNISKLWYKLKYKCIHNWMPMWLVYRLYVPKGYDVEVAFIEGFATKLLAASSNKKAKKVAWVHCDLKNQPWTLQQGIYRSLEEEKKAYMQYDKVVCVSILTEKVMSGYYGLNNTTTIYNPIDDKSVIAYSKESVDFPISKDDYNIVSVGRLERVKGYDMLLPIIKHLKESNRKVHLWLIGEGSQRFALEHQAQELGISELVTFTGFLKNPYALMSKMDLFVCSSRAEGFSLVIAEAMILGVPVLSMNCRGPKEILNDKQLLCENYEELQEKIINALNGQTQISNLPQFVNISKTIASIEGLFT